MARNQRDPMFKQRHFDAGIILICARWEKASTSCLVFCLTAANEPKV